MKALGELRQRSVRHRVAAEDRGALMALLGSADVPLSR